MTTLSEKVFPRGGRNPALSNKPARAPSFSLFGKGSSKVKKKVKKKKDVKSRDRNNKKSNKLQNQDVKELKPRKELKVKYVDDLSPNILHDGMLVLGTVSDVTDKVVHISLPGGLRGIVKLTNVSQFYKELIVNAKGDTYVPGLQDLFKIGEIYPTRVISVCEDSRVKFLLTLDPKLINSKISEMETGMILLGSVKSEEDYGYVIDFGIQSVNGFLNFQKIEKGKEFPIGKLVRCIVTKSQGMSNVEVSMLQDDLKKGCLSSDSSCPIHSFIPGFQFKVTVKKVLTNGLEVRYGEDENLKGFIYEDHLSQLFPKLSKIVIGTKYVGTLLYIKPLVNLPYFKVISYKPENWIYRFGQIVRGKVMKSSRSGVTFRIGKKLFPTKCFIPVSKLSDSDKLIEHDLDVDTIYPAGRIVDKIRLKGIDYMRRCYVGATDKSALDEKYFSISDLKCGDVVPCKIESIGNTIAKVKIGKVSGIVSIVDMTDIPMRNPGAKFKVGQKVKGMVTDINMKTHSVRLTMKPTLLKSKLKTLSDYSQAKLNESYTGTVIMISEQALIVRFLNGVVGNIPKNLTPHSSENSLTSHYTPGQLVKCYVVNVIGKKLVLSLTPPKTSNLKTGEKYEVVVTGVESYGLRIRVKMDRKDEPVTGMIPSELLWSYPGLGEAMRETFAVQQKLTAYYVYQERDCLPIFAVCDTITRFYDNLVEKDVHSLVRIGRIYPFLYSRVKRKTGETILCPVIPSGNYRFTVRKNFMYEKDEERIRKYQIVYGVIKGYFRQEVDVSLSLSEVWDRRYQTSLELLDSYLDGMKRLIQHHREKNEEYVKDVRLGSVVTSAVADKSGVIHEIGGVKNGDGDVITGRVVWIRGEKKVLCVNARLTGAAEVSDEDFEVMNTTYRAEIVYIGDEVIVALLKGKGNGQLVMLPRKRHENDFNNARVPYVIGGETRVWVERTRLNNLVGIDRQVKLLEEKQVWKSLDYDLRNTINSLKRKAPTCDEDEMEIIAEKLKKEDDDVQFDGETIPQKEIKQEEESDECMDVTMDVMDASRVEIKSEEDSTDEKEKGKDSDIYSKERIFLSSSSESESDEESSTPRKQNGLNVGFDWNVVKHRELLSGATSKPEEDSSSDDDEESKNAKKKRVRLSKSEREEKAREEEDRLRLIEERLIRSDLEPETADDFDRALLAKPNSSALWVKYMAFHLEATEIEKARAVARRALKTIAFNEEREKLNVWVALLNLENLYGNEESLNKTLGEALMCNEPFHVHLHMMNMHGQSGKFQEMERIGNMIMKKFKDVENMWDEVGLAYFKVGKLESARHVMQRALPMLEKKKHVELISKFAQMENRYGSSERAQTLYETILGSFPKRVDVWSCYVDMLVKSDSIDLARQVLERATSQNLPPKKMKTLFKKFLSFEEKHGTPENVEKVRQSAVDYVEAVGAKAAK